MIIHRDQFADLEDAPDTGTADSGPAAPDKDTVLRENPPTDTIFEKESSLAAEVEETLNQTRQNDFVFELGTENEALPALLRDLNKWAEANGVDTVDETTVVDAQVVHLFREFQAANQIDIDGDGVNEYQLGVDGRFGVRSIYALDVAMGREPIDRETFQSAIGYGSLRRQVRAVFEGVVPTSLMESFYNAMSYAETGRRERFVRTEVDNATLGLPPSSAYGPVQITKTLVQDSLARNPHIFDLETRRYAIRFIEQGELMLAHSRGEHSDPRFGLGGSGVLTSDNDKRLYRKMATALIEQEYRESPGIGEDKVRNFVRRWRGAEDTAHLNRFMLAYHSQQIQPDGILLAKNDGDPEDFKA